MVMKITAYKTSDGSIFTHKKVAVKYQLEQDISSSLLAWVTRWAWSGMSKSDVVESIMKNIDELMEIIEGKNKS